MKKKQMLGHELEDILIKCTFNYKLCSLSDFSWSFDDVYGNCYSFNSGFYSNGTKEPNAKGTPISGSEFGLQLTLYRVFFSFYQI
jgi:hypothetical protein